MMTQFKRAIIVSLLFMVCSVLFACSNIETNPVLYPFDKNRVENIDPTPEKEEKINLNSPINKGVWLYENGIDLYVLKFDSSLNATLYVFKNDSYVKMQTNYFSVIPKLSNGYTRNDSKEISISDTQLQTEIDNQNILFSKTFGEIIHIEYKIYDGTEVNTKAGYNLFTNNALYFSSFYFNGKLLNDFKYFADSKGEVAQIKQRARIYAFYSDYDYWQNDGNEEDEEEKHFPKLLLIDKEYAFNLSKNATFVFNDDFTASLSIENILVLYMFNWQTVSEDSIMLVCSNDESLDFAVQVSNSTITIVSLELCKVLDHTNFLKPNEVVFSAN